MKTFLIVAAAMFLVVAVVGVVVTVGGGSVQGSGAAMTLNVSDKDKTQLVCGEGAPLRKCGTFQLDEGFSVDVLASAIPPEGYTRFNIVLDFSSDILNLQQQDGFDEVVWPDGECTALGFGEETKEPGRYIITCKRDAGTPNSMFLGVLANVQFTCKTIGAAQIELVGGNSFDKSSYYFRPAISGSFVFPKVLDSVQVNCADATATPTPTITPTQTNTLPPPTSTPTITPTKTPTITPTKEPGPKMHLTGFADKAKQVPLCDKGESDRKCGRVPVGDAFSVDVIAFAIPPEGYTRFQVVLSFPPELLNLQQQDGFDEVIWPDEGCDLIGRGEETKDVGQYVITCKRDGTQNSQFTGPLVNVQFECKQAGLAKIEIVGGNNISKSSYYFRPTISGNFVFLSIVDSIDISCIPPKQDDPGDTDLDGCSDVQENGPDGNFGGLRDYFYFWDFYDVWTHPIGDPVGWERNKVINIIDIIATVQRFGPGPNLNKVDALSAALVQPTDDTSYHPGYDRGPIFGPFNWSREPADGAINVPDDILGIANQFGHSCL